MSSLPRMIRRVGVPPIKCQGIKTKLVPFIAQSIEWSQKGRWIEPFLGSGVVAFNIAPERAILADTNKHIVHFYRCIQDGSLTANTVRRHLEAQSPLLAEGGSEYYYEVRKRFNESADSLDFLFLNRSCFNGILRFNRKGDFNVPFGHKPQRFSKAYITKISNQVGWLERQMYGKDWEFRVSDWREVVDEADADDLIYMDPPYIGRHTDYFNAWDEREAEQLALAAMATPAGVALSMWQENKYRRNDHLDLCWPSFERRLFAHFYHVGSSENLRNEMHEALAIKPGYAADVSFVEEAVKIIPQQLAIAID